MNRRERNALLDRLMVYRRVYHLRGDYDAKPILTVAAAVAYVDRLMRLPVAPTTAQAT